MKIEDIAFWIIIIVCSLWIIWELIPDPAKKYWNYILSVSKDRRKGRRRKYSFIWRKEA